MKEFIYRELLGTAWYVEAHYDMEEAKLCCPKGWRVAVYKGILVIKNSYKRAW